VVSVKVFFENASARRAAHRDERVDDGGAQVGGLPLGELTILLSTRSADAVDNVRSQGRHFF